MIKSLSILIITITTLLINKPHSLYSQNNFKYETFLNSIGPISDDSLAYVLYSKSGEFLILDSLNPAKVLIKHCIQSAEKINDTDLIGKANIQQGIIQLKLFEFNNSLKSFRNALQISKTFNDSNLMLDAISGIENYYVQTERIDSAIFYCTKAISICKSQKNYINLSDKYRTLRNYQISLTNNSNTNSFLFDGLMDSSLNAAKKVNNPSHFVYILTGFGLELYNRDSLIGFEYLQAAVDSARKLPSPANALVYALTKSSTCYAHSGQIEKAKVLLNEALPLAIKLNDTRQLTHLYYIQGRILINQKLISQSIKSYKKAIKLAEKHSYNYYLPFIYKELFDLYYNEKIYDSSFVYQRKYMHVFEKEHDKELNNKIAKLSAMYQVTEKEEKIDNLKIINDQKKEIISTQKKLIISLISGIIVICVLFILLFRHYSEIKKNHIKLSEKSIEITKKNKEIAALRRNNDYKRENVYNELKINLDELFQDKNVYLEKELSLIKTAELLKTNTSYLSAFINKEYNCSFNQFINNYRIQYSCELLSNREMDIYTIEGIAELSGFNSKSVFNQAFKKATGVNPSFYRTATLDTKVKI